MTDDGQDIKPTTSTATTSIVTTPVSTTEVSTIATVETTVLPHETQVNNELEASILRRGIKFDELDPSDSRSLAGVVASRG
jgi:hypothetical protein